jgi:hypothetical protein
MTDLSNVFTSVKDTYSCRVKLIAVGVICRSVGDTHE